MTHLYTTNKEVTDHNNRTILKVGNPIARIESENTGSAKSMKDDVLGNLAAWLFLCVGSKVMLIRNYLNLGLSNGTTGIVKEIVYEPGKSAPALPKFVLVDFGTSYTGSSFFPDDESKRGWFPVFPVKNTSYTMNKNGTNGFAEHSRTMLPLKLCWAWTIHKAQGMSIDNNLVVNLGDKEMDHGLTYVALSRVTKFKFIGLKNGITKNRLCKNIARHKKMKPRIEEEKRLKMLCENTLKYFI